MPTPEQTYTLSTTRQIIAFPDPKRTSLMIINLDPATTEFITSNPVGTLGDGIPLYPLTTLVYSKGDGDRPDLGYYGEVGAGTANVLVVEGWED